MLVVVLWAATAALTACIAGDSEPPSGRSSGIAGSVSLLDSLVLEVPDSAALGTFSYITRERSGGFLISDVGRGRLLRYGSDGALRQVIGRFGAGPGEFRGASVARGLHQDSILAVVDPGRQYFAFLDHESGAPLGGMSVPFREAGQTWTEKDGEVVFGVQAATFLVGRLRPGEGLFTPIGQTPARLLANMFLFLSYGRVEAIPHGNGYLVMVPTVQGLHLLDSAGVPVGMVDIPVRRRRGKPADLLDNPPAPGGAMQLAGSVDGAMARLPNGSIAILNLDVTFEDAPPAAPRSIKYYVSILSPDLARACVDLEVPHDSTVTGPWPTFVDSDLLITSDRIEGDSVRTVVYRYGIDTAMCDWVRTGGVRPSLLNSPLGG